MNIDDDLKVKKELRSALVRLLAFQSHGTVVVCVQWKLEIVLITISKRVLKNRFFFLDHYFLCSCAAQQKKLVDRIIKGFSLQSILYSGKKEALYLNMNLNTKGEL